MKTKTSLKKSDNSREYKMIKRNKDLSCSFCKPHRGENTGRKPKHGNKKPKKKNKR